MTSDNDGTESAQQRSGGPIAGRAMTTLGDDESKKARGRADQATCCREFGALVDDPDVPLDEDEQVREWSMYILPIADPDQPDWRGYPVRQLLMFCPFCGFRFPESVRGEYFGRLRALGIDDPWLAQDEVPEEFRSDSWWREAGL